jgi:hypothetical protein
LADWYWIGSTAGIAVGCGIAFSGSVTRRALAALLAAAVGVGVGLALGEWDEAVGGAVGGLAGVVGSAPVVRGALTRGGSRGGTAALVGLAGLVVAALALVPAVGYLEAVTASVLAVRLRRHSGKRFAGLRILARD